MKKKNKVVGPGRDKYKKEKQTNKQTNKQTRTTIDVR